MRAMFYKGVVRKVNGKECERESRESGVLGGGEEGGGQRHTFQFILGTLLLS